MDPSLKFQPVRLLSQNGHRDIEKRVRKQVHACCMDKNYDSLTQHSQHVLRHKKTLFSSPWMPFVRICEDDLIAINNVTANSVA